MELAIWKDADNGYILKLDEKIVYKSIEYADVEKEFRRIVKDPYKRAKKARRRHLQGDRNDDKDKRATASKG